MQFTTAAAVLACVLAFVAPAMASSCSLAACQAACAATDVTLRCYNVSTPYGPIVESQCACMPDPAASGIANSAANSTCATEQALCVAQCGSEQAAAGFQCTTGAGGLAYTPSVSCTCLDLSGLSPSQASAAAAAASAAAASPCSGKQQECQASCAAQPGGWGQYACPLLWYNGSWVETPACSCYPANRDALLLGACCGAASM